MRPGVGFFFSSNQLLRLTPWTFCSLHLMLEHCDKISLSGIETGFHFWLRYIWGQMKINDCFGPSRQIGLSDPPLFVLFASSMFSLHCFLITACFLAAMKNYVVVSTNVRSYLRTRALSRAMLTWSRSFSIDRRLLTYSKNLVASSGSITHSSSTSSNHNTRTPFSSNSTEDRGTCPQANNQFDPRMLVFQSQFFI